MSKYQSTRAITALHPRLRSLFIAFDTAMRSAGIDYIVTATYRNDDDQNALYAQGRTKKGAIVTNAQGGESKHNCVDRLGAPCAEAFDIAIMSFGKCDWNVKNPNWRKAGIIGKSVGLEWAGDWISFKEFPHFQLPKE